MHNLAKLVNTHTLVGGLSSSIHNMDTIMSARTRAQYTYNLSHPSQAIIPKSLNNNVIPSVSPHNVAITSSISLPMINTGQCNLTASVTPTVSPSYSGYCAQSMYSMATKGTKVSTTIQSSLKTSDIGISVMGMKSPSKKNVGDITLYLAIASGNSGSILN